MNYWIFIVTSHTDNGDRLTGEDILNTRLSDKFWGLGQRTANRASLRQGDEIVFYVGLPKKVFAATATLAGESFKLSDQERDAFSHGRQFYRADYGVRLEEIVVWEMPRRAEDLAPHLQFIENKKSWFAYFQGGVRGVTEQDFRTITEVRFSDASALRRTEEIEEKIENESEFALETHLEEFIDNNWDHINFGVNLKRYQTDEQNGRQFTAGPWSIDFLCTDESDGALVVLELKRGKPSDAVVGQILRYIGWVRQNVSLAGQHVRGIIVAKEVDEALQYATEGLSGVSVLTYRVDFSLTPFAKRQPKGK